MCAPGQHHGAAAPDTGLPASGLSGTGLSGTGLSGTAQALRSLDDALTYLAGVDATRLTAAEQATPACSSPGRRWTTAHGGSPSFTRRS